MQPCLLLAAHLLAILSVGSEAATNVLIQDDNGQLTMGAQSDCTLYRSAALGPVLLTDNSVCVGPCLNSSQAGIVRGSLQVAGSATFSSRVTASSLTTTTTAASTLSGVQFSNGAVSGVTSLAASSATLTGTNTINGVSFTPGSPTTVNFNGAGVTQIASLTASSATVTSVSGSSVIAPTANLGGVNFPGGGLLQSPLFQTITVWSNAAPTGTIQGSSSGPVTVLTQSNAFTWVGGTIVALGSWNAYSTTSDTQSMLCQYLWKIGTGNYYHAFYYPGSTMGNIYENVSFYFQPVGLTPGPQTVSLVLNTFSSQCVIDTYAAINLQIMIFPF